MHVMRKLPIILFGHSGLILNFCIELDFSPNQKHDPRRPASLEEGRYGRSSPNESAGCDGALASRVRSARADERCPGRTTKSCGPVAPTLAISCADDVSATMGARKPGPQGDHV